MKVVTEGARKMTAAIRKLTLAAAAIAMAGAFGAFAQSYPTKPIRFVVFAVPEFIGFSSWHYGYFVEPVSGTIPDIMVLIFKKRKNGIFRQTNRFV